MSRLISSERFPAHSDKLWMMKNKSDITLMSFDLLITIRFYFKTNTDD
ncbi:MAG: hypothetical protein JXR61_09665 [Prolixibacteraceae bacterium]|nr:hypothetical protein [Prolixibacteraceae bacterium]